MAPVVLQQTLNFLIFPVIVFISFIFSLIFRPLRNNKIVAILCLKF